MICNLASFSNVFPTWIRQGEKSVTETRLCYRLILTTWGAQNLPGCPVCPWGSVEGKPGKLKPMPAHVCFALVLFDLSYWHQWKKNYQRTLETIGGESYIRCVFCAMLTSWAESVYSADFWLCHSRPGAFFSTFLVIGKYVPRSISWWLNWYKDQEHLVDYVRRKNATFHLLRLW